MLAHASSCVGQDNVVIIEFDAEVAVRKHFRHDTFELKHFFSGGYRTRQGMDVASTSIKQRLKEIVRDEDQKKPYSDQKLAERLTEEGVTVARRTVAKYREELGIDVEAQEPYDHIQYTGREGRPIDVTFMFARRVGGEPRPLEVEAVKWAPINTLDQVEFIPANRDVVQRLQQETIGRDEREEKNR